MVPDTVTIYPVNVHGRTRWRLDQSVNGKRVVRSFASKGAAEAASRESKAAAESAGQWWVSLSARERLELVAVASEARDAGVSLRHVWDEWRAAQALPARQERTLAELVAEALAAKATAGRRGRYVENLRVVWGAFIRGLESMPVSQVTAGMIEDWLSSRSLSMSTRASQLSRVSTLLAFSVRRGYLESNPAGSIEVPSVQHDRPAVLTVDQCRELIEFVRAHHPRLLAWFALALFAGIRPEECDRMTWSDVGRHSVTVDAAASKVRQRRIITLETVAKAWLRVARRLGSDLPIPHATRRRAVRAARDHLGLTKWPQDVLRHTAASMLLAIRRDAAAVALELGNSPGVLFRHYRELVTPAEAERWRRLLPRRASA
jgi:integrase